LRDRAALGAARPTGDADSRDQHSGGSPTDSPTGLDEGPPRSVRPASPGTRAIAAPASHDERAPRLMRSSRSQRDDEQGAPPTQQQSVLLPMRAARPAYVPDASSPTASRDREKRPMQGPRVLPYPRPCARRPQDQPAIPRNDGSNRTFPSSGANEVALSGTGRVRLVDGIDAAGLLRRAPVPEDGHGSQSG
jgi:hypothetical protein